MSSHQAENRKKQVTRSSRVTKVCANKHLEAEQWKRQRMNSTFPSPLQPVETSFFKMVT